MKKFIHMGNFEPVNLDYLITFEHSDSKIIFYLAGTSPNIVWSLYNSEDARKIYKEILLNVSTKIDGPYLEGNYK